MLVVYFQRGKHAYSSFIAELENNEITVNSRDISCSSFFSLKLTPQGPNTLVDSTASKGRTTVQVNHTNVDQNNTALAQDELNSIMDHHSHSGP